MRADARRNAERLRTAAAELFHERGLQAPLKEIARRAGVSPGTLYNLFGTREALIDEVLADLAAQRLDAVGQRALAAEDPWTGLREYVLGVCELQATEPAIGDVITRRAPGAEGVGAVCDRSYDAAARVVERARQAGAVRADVTPTDLFFVLGANAVLARATEPVAPGAWRRGVALTLDGLRASPTDPTDPLPAPALTAEQMDQATSRLNAARDGRAG